MGESEDYGELHTPLARMMAERVKPVPERFTWSGQVAPRQRKPILKSVPWSPSYGPHICPVCYGARFLRDVETIGKLIPCLTCGTVEQQQVNRELTTCWYVGGLKPDTPNPPTFDDFGPRDAAASLQLKETTQFARVPRGFLTMWGPWGGGKTHLAQAAARSLLQRRQPCCYITAPALFEYLGAVHRHDDDDTDYTGRLAWAVYVKVLIIDELNKEGNSRAVADLRLSLLDARYQRAVSGEGGATMLISNDEPSRWHDPAVASRANDTRFTVVEATKVDFRKVQR